MPGQTFAERSAERRARLAALQSSGSGGKSWWQTIKDTASGFGQEAEDIYDTVKNTGKTAAEKIKAGDYPGAFQTVTAPVMQPFTGLQDFATKGLPNLSRKDATLQGADLVGVPASKMAQDVEGGNTAKAVGRGMFGAAMMGAGYGASRMFGRASAAPQLSEGILPPVRDLPPTPSKVSIAEIPVKDPGPSSPPRYMEGRYGVNRENWAESNPLLAHVPDRLRPASPTEAYFDSILPSRTRELATKPIDEFTQVGKPTGGPQVSKLPDVQEPGAKPVYALPAGTQSKLRRAGLSEEQIGQLDIDSANTFLKNLKPAEKPAKVAGKSRIQQQPELANNEAVKETVKQSKADRPFAETRDNDLEYLAKMGVKGAIRELEIRKKALGGFHVPNERPSVMDRLTDETGSLGPGSGDRIVRNRLNKMYPNAEAAMEDLAQQHFGKSAKDLAPDEYWGLYNDAMDLAHDLQPKEKPGDVIDLNAPPKRTLMEKLKDEKGAVRLEALVPSFFARERSAKPAAEEANPFMKSYADWVNSRKASIVEGILKKREFQDLDQQGLEGIKGFQSGLREGRFQDVSDYFNKKYEELTGAGVKVGFKENYLPQLWENPKSEVMDMQKRLGLKPKFSLPSILENYEVGIALGLKPRFQTISDLVGWYEKTAQKSLADRKFFDYLKDNQLIQPKGTAPPHWKTLDPDHFPVQKFRGVKKEYTGVLQAPPEVAKIINNYLRDPAEVGGGVLQSIADAASLSKNMVLSSGVPGTALNAHGANILARNMMARGVLRGGMEAARYLVHPKSAGDWLEQNLKSAPDAVRNGLQLTTEDHSMTSAGSTDLVRSGADAFRNTKVGKITPDVITNAAEKGLGKLMEIHGKFFEDPLFKNVIPALKLKHYNEVMADLTKQGMSPTEAGQTAAKTVNSLYGGINWEAMGRSRDLQNLLRASILAPDWFETNLRIGKGMGKALLDRKNPTGNAYAKAAANLVGAYVAANVANYATSGHLMVQNAPGHTLDIEAGKSGDKIRYIRPFGTAADFFRLPYDTAAAALGKEKDYGQAFAILANRMSVPAHVTTHLLTRTDHYGRPLTGKDAYGRVIPPKDQAANILGEVSEMVTPQYVNSGVGVATGRLNTEQALLGGLEAPVRYAKPPQKGKKKRARLPRVR